MFHRLLAAIRAMFGSARSSADDLRPTQPIPRNEMPRLKAHLCGIAERIASEGFGTRLDYSIESIKEVERILGAMHEDYKRTGSDDGMNGIALEFAAYIATVIDRHFGPAQWERDDPTFGPDAFPLVWRGSSLFIYAWCQKRIFDGPGDDVWAKFHCCVLSDEGPTVAPAPR